MIGYHQFALVLLVLTAGCGQPIAPSVQSKNGIATSWDHLRSESWNYSLQDTARVEDLHFYPTGMVRASIGNQQGNEVSVAPIMYHWHLSAAGELIITEDRDGKVEFKSLSLVSLDSDTALVRDSTNPSKARVYHRTFMP